MLKIAVVTLFPEMFTAITESGITRRAFESGQVEIAFFNPRTFAEDKHNTIDDRPYGGGPGMVMQVEPLRKSVAAARKWFSDTASDVNAVPNDKGCDPCNVKVVYLTPQGRVLDRSGVKAIADDRNLILIAGRYEGIDERFIQLEVDEEWSIGDYVLSGGELPAMVLIDAMVRREPEVLGDSQSVEQDSFEHGILDCPHYTRPEMIDGLTVPDVLLSGDHKKIAEWRSMQALGRTWLKRPDLIEALKKAGHFTEKMQVELDKYLEERRFDV